MNRSGFTLVECLIALALSLVALAAGLGFYAGAQKSFLRLKEREEAGQAALAALDRMRIDLLHAGLGLVPEMALGLVEAAEVTDGELRTTAAERTLVLAGEAQAGETRLSLVSTADIAAGRRILLREGGAGEIRTVRAVDASSVLLDAPLERAYAPEAACVSLLELVAYYRDGASRILRRRANASSAQPVLEGVAAADWSLEGAAPLVRIRLELDTKGAHPHEATVFLENLALVRDPGS